MFPTILKNKVLEEKWHLLSQNTQLVNPEEKAAIEKKFAEARVLVRCFYAILTFKRMPGVNGNVLLSEL